MGRTKKNDGRWRAPKKDDGGDYKLMIFVFSSFCFIFFINK